MSFNLQTQQQLVIDASVAVKWFLPEAHAETALRIVNSDVSLMAPDLIWAELGNVLWKKWRQGRLDVKEVQALLDDFARAPLEIHPSGTLNKDAWLVAHSTGRGFYDSLYVALAMRTSSVLITADERLHNALKGSGWARYCIWLGDVA